MESPMAEEERISKKTATSWLKRPMDWLKRFMKKREDFEMFLSFAFGLLALLAISLNVSIKGVSAENILDAVKDAAGIAVTVIVFVVARRVYRQMTHVDFVGRFEKLLKEWADKNRYLVDKESIKEERGKAKKRCYDMLVDPSNLVTAEVKASEPGKKKGSFVYLPLRSDISRLTKGGDEGTRDDLTIEFRLNKSTFVKSTFVTQRGDSDITDDDIALIARKFAERINDEFGVQLATQARIKDGDSKVIIVPLSTIPRTEENARLLVDLVDFVKNMVLALSKPSEGYLKALRTPPSNQ